MDSENVGPEFGRRRKMKRVWLAGVIATLTILMGLSSLYAQPRGRGGMGHGDEGMGHGMMGRGGMMHQESGMGPDYGPGNIPQDKAPKRPIDETEATDILQNYLESTRNPNLKLGKIEDKGQTFEAEILTKDEALVDRVVVDKTTGWLRSVY
jgi:hypothetical protein